LPHDYAGVVFGHASAGNLHFLITPFLNDEKTSRISPFDARRRRACFRGHDGPLKAEHGTGRNVAFVEREWGPKLTD
jgi:D-lactate dehydrogenase